MLHPQRLAEVRPVLKADDFYRPDHAQLYALLNRMDEASEPIDTITVTERIQREGLAERYGGVAYVVELPDHAMGASNILYYARVIREKALLRGLVSVGRNLADTAMGQPEDVGQLLERASRELSQLSASRDVQDWEQVSLIVDHTLSKLEAMAATAGSVTGLTTGFADLDDKLAGLQPSDLIILAARPAMGKTALALNIAQNAAIAGSARVAVFSLEMSRVQLVTRMMSCEARVDAGRLRSGTLEQPDWDALLEASDVIRRARIHILDTPGLSISEVRAACRRLASEHGKLGLVVIDYLQLMQGDDPRAPREQQISAISRGLKGLAKELDAPVIALSQLNRAVEARQNKRPLVSDLRESGAIEQDADIIMFIYRDEYYNPDSPDKGLAEVIIAKQRNGPTGTVKLVFEGRHTRFDNHVADDLGL
jgi:replicative DNA helicase